MQGIKSDIKSRYWEYSFYYSDGVLWDKAVLFESFGGTNFQGNPYYIYREIFNSNEYLNFKLYISHKIPDNLQQWLKGQKLYDSRVRIVETGQGEYRNILAHAKYLVNNVSFNMDYIKKPGQVYLNTWHGTPLKTLGRNILNDPFECNNAQRNFLMCNYLIAPNELTKKVFLDDYMVRDIMPGQIKMQGYPRNAVFFSEESRSKIKERYGLSKITSVFYMPTWRGTACGIDDIDQVCEIERLAQELGDNYRVYVKFHPAMGKTAEDFQYCYNMPSDIEVYEFLNAVDILITDYSSVFFDFANTGKKIVLYQYDKEIYYKSRGVYEEVEKNIPFSVAYHYDELLSIVRDMEKQEYSEFTERFCPTDKLTSAKEAVQLLFSDTRKQIDDPVNLYIVDFPITDKRIIEIEKKLGDEKYRFVFIPKRSNHRFRNLTRFSAMNYLVLYTYSRLSVPEKIKFSACKIMYKIIKSPVLYDFLKKLTEREQMRLWGNMNIGHIYAKGKYLPLAIALDAESWPENI